MRFESIHLDGFGRLGDVTFDLSPGLNIFCGANEAGKSTLQQGIWALLYGFYKGDRRTTAESQMLDRFQPWGGGAYGGQLVYRLDNGRAFRVVRSFDANDPITSLFEADTGRDITNRFERGKLGRVAFTREHFGMSEEVFVNTCFVRQADLHRLAEAAQAVTETIVNLAGTGNQDRSVSRAIELLTEALRDQVGSARAYTKPLPQAYDRLEKHKEEKQQILERREALVTDYQSRTQLFDRKQQLVAKADQLQYWLAVGRRDRLTGRVQRIETLLSQRTQLEDRLAGLQDASELLLVHRDTILRLHQGWVACHEAWVRTSQEVEASRSAVNNLREHRQTLIEAQRPLEAARSIPLEQEHTIRQLHQVWWDALKAVQRAREALQPVQAAVDALAPVHEKAQQNAALMAVDLGSLHDLITQGATAEADLSAAEREREAAERSWQSQPLSLEAYQKIRDRLGQLKFEDLSVIKERVASLKQLEMQIGPTWLDLVAWLLLIVGGLATVAGVVTLGLTLARRSLGLWVIGIAALVGGLGITVFGLVNLRLKAKRRGKWLEADRQLARELERLGCKGVSELEADHHALLAANAPYEQLGRAHEIEAVKRSEVERIEDEARVLLGLQPQASLNRASLEAAELMLRDLRDQVSELNRCEEEQNRLRETATKAQEVLAHAETQLQMALRQCMFEGADLAREVDRFHALCDHRRQLEKIDSELRAVEAELQIYATKEREAKSAATDLDTARSELMRVLRQIGIDETDPEQAFRLFKTARDRAESAQQLRTKRDGLVRELQAFLGSHSLDQLKQQHDARSREAQALLAANPVFAGLTVEDLPEALQQQLEDINYKSIQATHDLATIEQRLHSAEAGLRSLAEVEEDIVATQITIAELEVHRRALELAIEHLKAAADEHHRNFLPRLNQIVGQNLSRVTGGRYTDVLIDHADLQIRLQVPDRPERVTPDVLSRGTQEQIYLLLRLGLTELMSRSRERLPLILDDPLVNYDHDRLLYGLDFLAEMAAQTQVLLFTKDEETAHWFRSRIWNTDTHKLHEL